MIYIQSVGFLCQNAHTTTTCLAGAPHSLKLLWDAAENYPWATCPVMDPVLGVHVRHMGAVQPPLLPPPALGLHPSFRTSSPVRSSADSSFPCTDTPHARGALSAWLQCLWTATASQLEKGLPGLTLIFCVYLQSYISPHLNRRDSSTPSRKLENFSLFLLCFICCELGLLRIYLNS